jgi:hypothetical protein
MLRRGAITTEMHDAGERFRALFLAAQLDPLHAAGQARRAVPSVGGPASPAGSCLWHVIGAGRSLKEWAFQGTESLMRYSRPASVCACPDRKAKGRRGRLCAPVQPPGSLRPPNRSTDHDCHHFRLRRDPVA